MADKLDDKTARRILAGEMDRAYDTDPDATPFPELVKPLVNRLRPVPDPGRTEPARLQLSRGERSNSQAREGDERYVRAVTLRAKASVTTAASPQAVLEYVLDLNRYRRIDPKIVRVFSVSGPDSEGRGSVRLLARMRGLPPAPDKQDFVLERWTRLTFTGAGRQPARLIFGFTGVVECAPAADGTTVTHRYEFRFHGPFRPVERLLAGWLQRQIEQEVQDLAQALA